MQFINSVNNVPSDQAPAYPHVIIGGEFNLAGINWENMEITGHSYIEISKTLIDCIQQHNLTHLTRRATRGENIIDLLFTSNPNNPSPSYDHDAVFFEQKTCLFCIFIQESKSGRPTRRTRRTNTGVYSDKL